MTITDGRPISPEQVADLSKGDMVTVTVRVDDRVDTVGPIALCDGLFGSLLAGPHGPTVRHSNGQGGIRLLGLTVHEP